MRASLVVTGLFACGVGLGAMTGAAAAERAQDPYAHLDLFARVLTTIERDYVEEIPTERLVDAAVRGMLTELDRHSNWMSARQVQALVEEEAEGTVSGLGLEIKIDSGAPEVARVLPGGAASREGLAPGDRILAVDGTPVGELEAGVLRERLTGARGEQVRLTVFREGWDHPMEVVAVHDRVHAPAARGQWAGPGLAYVRVAQFQAGTAAEIQLEVGRLSAESPLKGLVLDLRDNPGGLLTEAVATADLFLDSGPIVSTRRRTATQAEELLEATPGGLGATLPVVVLINGGSASASEIVAAALQETGRGVLVGERTYGKGTVQQVYRHVLPGGPVVDDPEASGEETAALKLTVGRYYTASGEPVADREGRAPDHVVPYPRASDPRSTLEAAIRDLARDPGQRDALLAQLDAMPATEPEPAPIRWEAPMPERLVEDPQLRRAVELLRGDGAPSGPR